MQAPKISCVLLTKNRSSWLPRAVELFRRQTWPNKELIIAERQDSNSYCKIPTWSNVIRFQMGNTDIPKRNRKALLAATGEFIAYWEDDDWIAPNRLEVHVRPLIEGKAGIVGSPIRTATVLMMKTMTFAKYSYCVEKREWADKHKGKLPGLPCLDGTAIFNRRVLGGPEDPAFNHQKVAFLRTMVQRGLKFMPVDADKLYVYVRHNSNLSRFGPEHEGVPIPRPNWIPADQWEFWRVIRGKIGVARGA